MAMHICEKSNFTFNLSHISRVRLVNKTVVVTYNRLGGHGTEPIIGFDTDQQAEEAYREIAQVLAEKTKAIGTRG